MSSRNSRAASGCALVARQHACLPAVVGEDCGRDRRREVREERVALRPAELAAGDEGCSAILRFTS